MWGATQATRGARLLLGRLLGQPALREPVQPQVRGRHGEAEEDGLEGQNEPSQQPGGKEAVGAVHAQTVQVPRSERVLRDQDLLESGTGAGAVRRRAQAQVREGAAGEHLSRAIRGRKQLE